MTLGTWLHTKIHGKFVGKDNFGNAYYVARRAPKYGKAKRWVLYHGMPEASKVPPMWHAWLHYMTDTLPLDMDVPTYGWQKEHLPNLTGTRHAYKPKGDLASGGMRDASTSDYDAWNPDEGVA
jgi:NADH:ubiquinone oxidoreductase subunit